MAEQEAAAPAEDAPTDDPAATPDPSDEVDKWKHMARKHERESKANAKRLAELEAAAEEAAQAAMSDHERAIEQARSEAAEAARSEVQSAFHRRLFEAEVRAASAGNERLTDLLSDGDVAQRLLGLAEIPINESGSVDTTEIATAIAALTESKPYLVSDKRPAAGFDGGAKGAAPDRVDPSSMSVEEMHKYLNGRN